MDSWGWMNPHNDLWARDDGSANGIGNTNGGSTNSFAGQNNDTSQAALINEFRFAAAKSIRTSVIILAAFNVVAAFATAVGIIWHSYATKKRKDPRFKFLCVGINGRAMRRLVKLTCTRACGFTFVAPAETFPLVLSVGIVVQGITFAVAQSTGLKSMLILGCTTTSQMMLPGPSIQSASSCVLFANSLISGFHRPLYSICIWPRGHLTGITTAAVRRSGQMDCRWLPCHCWHPTTCYLCRHAFHSSSQLLLWLPVLVCPALEGWRLHPPHRHCRNAPRLHRHHCLAAAQQLPDRRV